MQPLSLSNVFVLFLLAVLSSPWPWRPFAGKLEHNMMIDKQAETQTGATASITDTTAKATATAASTAANSDTTASSNMASITATTGTGTNTAMGTDSKTKTSSASTTTDYLTAATGGVSMLTPSAGETTYYKIGNFITFVWNYTSLSVTPTAVNVAASCSLNSEIYTISSHMSVQATETAIWDTGSYQANTTVPLLTANYTLVIWDASKGMSDTASGGHLAAASTFFGMYIPQLYTPLNEYICVTCNSALSNIERNMLRFSLSIAMITIFTFTWFTCSFGTFDT